MRHLPLSKNFFPSDRMVMAKKVTGIYGGSFNPVHVGHIALARQLLRLGGLDEIWLMVSPQNPLKCSSDLLDDTKRLEMTRLALSDEIGLVASDYEFHLPRPSYMWNTLCVLSHDYPNREFVLIIGADNWAVFSQWYHADDIIRHYRILIYPRTGFDIDKATLPQGVTLVETGRFDVSSTMVRERLKEGLPIDGLVPEIIVPLVERYYKPVSETEQVR